MLDICRLDYMLKLFGRKIADYEFDNVEIAELLQAIVPCTDEKTEKPVIDYILSVADDKKVAYDLYVAFDIYDRLTGDYYIADDIINIVYNLLSDYDYYDDDYIVDIITTELAGDRIIDDYDDYDDDYDDYMKISNLI